MCVLGLADDDRSLTTNDLTIYSGCMVNSFPKVYPILDASMIPATGRAAFLDRLGRSLAECGATLLEYRNKAGADAELLADAAVLRTAMPFGQVKLILDDRADLVEQSGFDGVHVDAGDVSPAEARSLLGPERIVGTFGGSGALVAGILDEPVDYLAVGPVNPTTTKRTSTPPIGVEGVRRLREEAGGEAVLVAVGGVTLETALLVLAAGADSVGVSAALFNQVDPAAEYRRWVAALG